MINNLKNYGDVIENASLKTYNTYRVESTAKLLLIPNSINDLISTIKELRENNIKYIVIFLFE